MIGDPQEWRNNVFAELDRLDDEISDLFLRHRALVRHRQFDDAGRVHGKLLEAEDKRESLFNSLPENRYWPATA